MEPMNIRHYYCWALFATPKLINSFIKNKIIVFYSIRREGDIKLNDYFVQKSEGETIKAAISPIKGELRIVKINICCCIKYFLI